MPFPICLFMKAQVFIQVLNYSQVRSPYNVCFPSYMLNGWEGPHGDESRLKSEENSGLDCEACKPMYSNRTGNVVLVKEVVFLFPFIDKSINKGTTHHLSFQRVYLSQGVIKRHRGSRGNEERKEESSLKENITSFSQFFNFSQSFHLTIQIISNFLFKWCSFHKYYWFICLEWDLSKNSSKYIN